MPIVPIIRQAYLEELDEIEGLVKEAYQEFRPLFPPDIWETWIDNLSQTIHSEAGIQLVVEADGDLQGTVKFYPDAAQAGLGRWPLGSASMRGLAVRPGSRTRGYGRLLVAECLRRAQELGVSTIYLYTGRFMHAARQLYEMMGFVRAEEFDGDPGPIAYRLDLGEEPEP
ncbi:MAG: GNAT family N-acetyltransferase [Syntrophobacterales bacterium]|jgi:N-acetylglutamate synthase-like GNAT family acetyltransferase